jgi:hypothetical protein
VNRRPQILSANKVFPHFDQTEAAGIILNGGAGAPQAGKVIYYFVYPLDILDSIISAGTCTQTNGRM